MIPYAFFLIFNHIALRSLSGGLVGYYFRGTRGIEKEMSSLIPKLLRIANSLDPSEANCCRPSGLGGIFTLLSNFGKNIINEIEVVFFF
jgi:hypothetical protein